MSEIEIRQFLADFAGDNRHLVNKLYEHEIDEDMYRDRIIERLESAGAQLEQRIAEGEEEG